MGKKTFTRPLFGIVFMCITIFTLAACGNTGKSGTSSISMPAVTTHSVPFKVTSVDLVVNPKNLGGKVCGSSASFTYTATFHVPANTAGGTMRFLYTLNNGHSSSGANIIVRSGETLKTYTFRSSGTLSADHTYPGIAEVMVNSPNTVTSPQVKPAGTCSTSGATFKVTSVTMAVSPSSIAGIACGTHETVTYTATFHIAANSPGGTIQFFYTVNNGRSSPGASVNTSPGQTTATYAFTWSGNLPADHTYPGLGGVITTSPNSVHSLLVKPTGLCR